MKFLRNIDFVLTRFVANNSTLVYNAARFCRCIVDKAVIYTDSFLKKDYILIYQQGRVASTSVYESIAKLKLPYRIFHVHLLSPQIANEKITTARTNKRKIERYLFVGKYLGEVYRSSKRGHWKVITIYREPISTMLSLQFLNADLAFRSIDLTADKEKLAKDILHKLQTMFENDNPDNWSICNWYDEVFKPELGVDIYGTPLNHQTNFTVIQNNNDLGILVLKFEDLKNAFEAGCREFFELNDDSVELLHSNVHKNDEFVYFHNYVKQNLRLSEQALSRIYSTKYCKHFYSEDDINEFKSKWGKKAL